MRPQADYGLVSRYGMVAFASSLDQAGPFAKSAEDLALLLDVIAGFDPRDSTSIERAKEDYIANSTSRFPACASAFRRSTSARGWRRTSAPRSRRRLRSWRAGGEARSDRAAELQPLGSGLLRDRSRGSVVNLSRFDGARYGYRAKDYTDLADMYRKTRAEGFGKEVRRRILIGTYVLSHGYYDAYYLKAQKIRRLIANDFTEAFKRCDVVIGPTSPTVAFKIGAKTATRCRCT